MCINKCCRPCCCCCPPAPPEPEQIGSTLYTICYDIAGEQICLDIRCGEPYLIESLEELDVIPVGYFIAYWINPDNDNRYFPGDLVDFCENTNLIAVLEQI